MSFQNDSHCIHWKLHLSAPPAKVYQMLSTNEGRARFWAASAVEMEGSIAFTFPGGQTWKGRILECQAPHRFVVEYLGGSVTTFGLAEAATGGTDLTLTDAGVPEEERVEVIAGWVSVLMALKAAVDFSVDLRNHDPARTWDQGFVDN